MAEKVTAASAIKAVHDCVKSLTKEDWERLRKIHELDAITCSAYMYPDGGDGENGSIQSKQK